MGFRRTKDEAKQSRVWKRFISDNRQLLADIGVPEDVLATQRAFDYFMMHGEYPGSPVLIEPAKLSPERKALIRTLVLNYFRSGLGDPGVSLLPPPEVDELRREAGLD